VLKLSIVSISVSGTIETSASKLRSVMVRNGAIITSGPNKDTHSKGIRELLDDDTES
jgi:hypothetical protein